MVLDLLAMVTTLLAVLYYSSMFLAKELYYWSFPGRAT